MRLIKKVILTSSCQLPKHMCMYATDSIKILYQTAKYSEHGVLVHTGIISLQLYFYTI